MFISLLHIVVVIINPRGQLELTDVYPIFNVINLAYYYQESLVSRARRTS